MQKYSVLMSLYKKEKPEYFRLALDSMISQTVKPDEIVLVEDGPLTNELLEVIDEYASKHSSLFNIVINERNLGLGLALNKGLKACKNELVARMDTDDISVVDRCERQLKYMGQNLDVDIVGGQIEEFVNDTGTIAGKRIVPIEDFYLKSYMKARCPFNHMTVMFRKSAVLESGNYQDWFWNEDYFLWIRMALSKKTFANLGNTLVYVRIGEEMYKRRGGWKYFKSEVGLQKYMFNQGIIGLSLFILNVTKRLIVQLMLPNCLRGWVFRKFARS